MAAKYHLDLKKQGDLRKCSILIAVTLLWHVALVSLVRHHTTPSLLFLILMVYLPMFKVDALKWKDEIYNYNLQKQQRQKEHR